MPRLSEINQKYYGSVCRMATIVECGFVRDLDTDYNATVGDYQYVNE